MAHVAMNWRPYLVRLGDEPGDQQGHVTVLVADGTQHRVASDALVLCAEAGSLIGIAATLADGRFAFWPAGSVVEIVDCAEAEA
jgi:hypothetical protein